MIESLVIRNLVLIAEANIQLGSGLNILTGETGAGKSAVLAALRLCLGERADASLIRKETDLAVVEAKMMGTVIRREIHRSGKSRSFINDELVTLAKLREALSSSIELVDQGAAFGLAEAEEQRKLLDSYGEIDLAAMKDAFEAATAAEKELAELQRSAEDKGRELERMRENLSFLDRIDWKSGEEENLSKEHHLLTHAQELAEKLSAFGSFLSEEPDPILPALKRFSMQLEHLRKIEPKLENATASLLSARMELEETAREIASYLDRLDANPHRLREIEERIGEIESVKRRLVKTQGESDELRASLREKIARIDQLEGEIENASSRALEMKRRMEAFCLAVTEARTKTARRLEQAVIQELKELNLPHAQFLIALNPKAASSNGADEITWRFTANPGQTPLSLDRAASGGELSRVLLAVKISMAKLSSKALIFDEIDSNVGGMTAAVLGAKLKTLAASCQIICVTHFVQVAKFATNHFLVTKQSDGELAKTELRELGIAQRGAEYARMMGES